MDHLLKSKSEINVSPILSFCCADVIRLFFSFIAFFHLIICLTFHPFLYLSLSVCISVPSSPFYICLASISTHWVSGALVNHPIVEVHLLFLIRNDACARPVFTVFFLFFKCCSFYKWQRNSNPQPYCCELNHCAAVVVNLFPTRICFNLCTYMLLFLSIYAYVPTYLGRYFIGAFINVHRYISQHTYTI